MVAPKVSRPTLQSRLPPGPGLKLFSKFPKKFSKIHLKTLYFSYFKNYPYFGETINRDPISTTSKNFGQKGNGSNPASCRCATPNSTVFETLDLALK